MAKRIGPAGQVALEYIKANPGCTAAAVDRARRTARNGHKWMYATINRLVAAGFVRRESGTGGRKYLYAR